MFSPLTLPCGSSLANRLVKSAMSDSLGDGTGHPTAAQVNLYERWAKGGVAAAIVGEVQGSPDYAEKPGNLVLNDEADMARFANLAERGSVDGTHLWLQLGHAGAMAYPPTSSPKGPSALNLPGLTCEALSLDDIRALPGEFAHTAQLAERAGFGGVQIHAAHGFLLSQFLSPLFNSREDAYGGSLGARMRLLLEVIDAVRNAVGKGFAVTVKLNSSDQLEGGLQEEEALQVIAAMNDTGIDLIDISGGTYFPGAKSASDSCGGGPYFVDFAKRARQMTEIPLMATGGFKTLAQAEDAVLSGAVDAVGLARAMAIAPSLPAQWRNAENPDPAFPRFRNPGEGDITAWYTMRLTDIGENRTGSGPENLVDDVAAYEARDRERTRIWRQHFGSTV
ncbi:oxidoreductase [Rhodobacterales bacterium]|nr:oxidoreductase [Rhodobacterales bacterium]